MDIQSEDKVDLKKVATDVVAAQWDKHGRHLIAGALGATMLKLTFKENNTSFLKLVTLFSAADFIKFHFIEKHKVF